MKWRNNLRVDRYSDRLFLEMMQLFLQTKAPEPETGKTKQNVEKSPSKVCLSRFPEILWIKIQIPRKSIDDDEVEVELADEHPSVSCPKRQTILVARTEEIQRKRSQLPIFSEEMNIVEAINDNLVTFVESSR